MRHLRWIPLLVLVFPASAAADDHRARTSAAISAASGSTLGGYHVTAEHEKFTDIKVNVPIDDARFAMPPQQQGPGPGRGH